MTDFTVHASSVEVSDKVLIAYFEGKGMTMAKQCNAGYCGTCRCRVSNPNAFEEVHDQLGYKDDNEVLLCSVKFKPGQESEFYFSKP
jgi:ferredoxin